MNNKIKQALIITVVVLLVGLFYVIISSEFERTNKAMDISKATGCEYLGSARDLNSVRFFECDGKIEMRRIK